MAERLPPLTALRAFEAAARHLSFARAADELHVTPAALSYQIRSLEENLGTPVFHRLNRAVELTAAGRALYPSVSDGFSALQRGWAAALRMQTDNTLTVTAGPAFTAKWLAPRMYRFAIDNPDIDLRFTATARTLDFVRDDVDVAIRYGDGSDDGLFSELLYEDIATPMMRPDLAERIRESRDLLEQTLIHDDSHVHLPTTPSWDSWFLATGIRHDPLRGPRFSHADHAIDMALEGAGVVMGRITLTFGALQSGQLVAPFRTALKSPLKFRIVCLPGMETRPAVARFRDWAKSEAERDRAIAAGFDLVQVGQAHNT